MRRRPATIRIAAQSFLALVAAIVLVLTPEQTAEAQSPKAEPIARQACETRLGGPSERAAFLHDKGWRDVPKRASANILKSIGRSVFALKHDRWDVGLYDASEMEKQFDIYSRRHREILASVRNTPDAASVMISDKQSSAIIFLQPRNLGAQGQGLVCQIWLKESQVSDRLRMMTADLKGRRDAFFTTAMVHRPTTDRPGLTTVDIIDAKGFNEEFGVPLDFTWRLQVVQTVLKSESSRSD